MKKNVMMRVAAMLLVCVLASTCGISGTFAKYVTSDSGSETARVAKFGVVVEAESFGMFTTDYDTTDTATFTGQYSVSAQGTSNRDDVMAPGTNGSFANISITGTPEVAVKVEVAPTVTISGTWEDADGNYYCPIIITVGTTEFCGLNYNSATEFADAIATELTGKSDVYAPNTNLASIYDNTNLDLSWRWVFAESDHAALSHTHLAGEQTDIRDTFLGDYAANTGDLKITIALTITVTQVD